jgi:hypothetical protein
VIFSAGTPTASTASTSGRISSKLVAMVAPFCPAIPFGLIATTSSLWMNFFIASAMLAAPVSSIIAFSSRRRAISSFGHS